MCLLQQCVDVSALVVTSEKTLFLKFNHPLIDYLCVWYKQDVEMIAVPLDKSLRAGGSAEGWKVVG